MPIFFFKEKIYHGICEIPQGKEEQKTILMSQQILSKIHFYRDLVASLVHLHNRYLYWVCSGEICRTQMIAVVQSVLKM